MRISGWCGIRGSWLLPPLLGLAVAGCGEDAAKCPNSDTVKLEIFDQKLTIKEKAANNPFDHDPYIFIGLDSTVPKIELLAADGVNEPSPGDLVIDRLLVLTLPEDAAEGTYSGADGASLGYSEDFDDSDQSTNLAYFSSGALAVEVKRADPVGGLWKGRFEAEMSDIGGGGGAGTTAAGCFTATREPDR